MRVIIAGDRYFGHIPQKPKPTEYELELFTSGKEFFTGLVIELWKEWKDMYGPITEVVSGDANGIDTIAKDLSRKITGKSAKRFPANWFEHKKQAGRIRNQEMADYSDGAIVIVGDGSVGSRDMIKKMEEKLLPVIVREVSDAEIDMYIPGLPEVIRHFRQANKKY